MVDRHIGVVHSAICCRVIFNWFCEFPQGAVLRPAVDRGDVHFINSDQQVNSCNRKRLGHCQTGVSGPEDSEGNDEPNEDTMVYVDAFSHF